MAKYLILSVAVALTVIVFAAWLPNLHLITRTMTGSTMTFWQKTNLLVSLLGSLQTNFTVFSQIVTLITAVLTGIQASLLTFYIRQTARFQQSIGVSLGGTLTSLLGIGCVSCSSVVLTSLFGFGTAMVVLRTLPFRGQEFGIIGISILLLAISLTIKKINQPLVCKLEEVK